MGKSKRRIDAKREPSGRLSRKTADERARLLVGVEKADRETLSVGLDARQRVHKVPAQNLRDQMAGSFVGRLCIGGMLSSAQYDAAMTYLEDWTNNNRAIHSPRVPGAVDLNATKGGNGDYENVAFYQRATSRWRNAVSAVQDRQNELRGAGALYAALDSCVIRDVSLDHMVGWLREALNALSRHYQFVDKHEAA